MTERPILTAEEIREFYELAQAYRHCTDDPGGVIDRYVAMLDWIAERIVDHEFDTMTSGRPG